MTKREMQELERVFTTEINGTFHQANNKTLKKLEASEHVVKITANHKNVTASFYRLTLLGHMTYCAWAAKQTEAMNADSV